MNEVAFTSFQFYSSGDEYYDSLIHEIQKASTEIQVEFYIFEFDLIGRKILEELGAAAKRGIDVRLMIDGIGSWVEISKIRDYCDAHNIQFRVYRAIPYLDTFIRQITRIFKVLNRRNHRKIVVLDRIKAFVGSYNISEVHSEKESGHEAWKDLGVLVEGPEVKEIAALNDTYWYRFPFSMVKRPPRLNFTRVRSTHSRKSRKQAKLQILTRIKEAKTRVCILTPYFVPSRKVIRSLITAAKNRTPVEILIPDRSDFLIVDLAGRYVLRKLLKYNIDVYQYSKSFMHAKAIIADNWATLGSHNLNHRSLIHDLELDIIIEKPDEIQPLLNYWLSLKLDSKQVVKADLEKDSFFIRMLCRFSFWFKNWL